MSDLIPSKSNATYPMTAVLPPLPNIAAAAAALVPAACAAEGTPTAAFKCC